MTPWQRIEPTNTTKAGWRTITSKTFKMPDGKSSVFDTIHPDGQEFVGVIALTPDNQVVVTRQYRPGPEKIMEDLPGGFVDPGETPQQSIERELLEETGYQPGRLQYLGAFHKDVYMNATWHAYIAYDCKKVAEPHYEQDEHIQLDLISISQLLHNAKNDKLLDHGLILLAYDELIKLQKEQ